MRSQYLNEIIEIFKVQKQLQSEEFKDLYTKLLSYKKGEGTIFYQRPIKSQKSNIGYCTFEPNKRRSPESHPDFETFRAWSLLNNIKIRNLMLPDSPLEPLDLDIKEQLMNTVFEGRVKPYFDFKELREAIEKLIGYKLSYKKSEINYKDNTHVPGCPISARLKKILGEDWRNARINIHRTSKNGYDYEVSYGYEDLWNICFQNEQDVLEEIIDNVLHFDEDKKKEMLKIWAAINANYASLSLKAIRNINRFLKKGLIYSDAVMLAKIPDLIGQERWTAD